MDFWNDIQTARSKEIKSQVHKARSKTIMPLEEGEIRYTPEGVPDPQGSVKAPYSMSGSNERMQIQERQRDTQNQLLNDISQGVQSKIDTPEKRVKIVDEYMGYYSEQIKDPEQLEAMRAQMLEQLERLAGAGK
jgi:hypothetical protein